MKKKSLLAICLVTALVLSLVGACAAPVPAPAPAPAPAPKSTPTPTPPKVISLRLQAVWHTAIRPWQQVEKFCETVSKVSGGRLEITPYPAAALVPTMEVFDALNVGVIDMSSATGSYWAGIFPEAGIEGGLPLVYRGTQDASTVFWELGMEDIVREAYAEHGIYYVALQFGDMTSFWTKKPIHSVDDLKGLKIRLYGEYLTLMNKLGASAVFIPHEETYLGLTMGTVDAAGTGISVWISEKMYEICPYLIQPALGNPSMEHWIMNMGVWQELPDDLKDIVTLAARESTYEGRRWLVYQVEKDVARVVDEFGCTVITLPDAEVAKMTKVAMTILDEYEAKSPRCAAMIKILRDYMKFKKYTE